MLTLSFVVDALFDDADAKKANKSKASPKVVVVTIPDHYVMISIYSSCKTYVIAIIPLYFFISTLYITTSNELQ
jgi:hypothetical protein